MYDIKSKLKVFIPYYVFIPFFLCWIWNLIIYNGTKLINKNLTHYDLTTSVDKKFPIIPEFLIIYFGCFLFWVFFYILCMRTNEAFCAKYFSFEILSRFICGIIFILLPTYNIRPDVNGNGIFDAFLLFLYKIDTADNLFPSIHCLISWNCFVGMRNTKNYKPIYTYLAFISALLVFASTLFTRQHVIADVISAVIISELSWIIVCKTNMDKWFGKWLTGMNEWLKARMNTKTSK